MPGFDLSGLGWTAELAASLEAGLSPGRVAVQHRGQYVVYTEPGELRAGVPGRLAHRSELPAVGDWVGTRDGVIHQLLPRSSAIVRHVAGRETEAQVLAANVDIAFLVSSLGPDLEPRRIERYLAVLWESGAQPVIILTKADLWTDPRELVCEVETVALGVPIHVVSAVTDVGMEAVQAYLRPGVTAVLLGSSGVGKSTIVNRIVGAELLRTREIREDDGKGRHTTSHRELVILPSGGMLIDTPGLRELQLWEGSSGMQETFADVETLAADCRFTDCTHAIEPGCAVQAAVDEGALPLDRLRSYRKLHRELELVAARQDARVRVERRKQIRRFARSLRKDRW